MTIGPRPDSFWDGGHADHDSTLSPAQYHDPAAETMLLSQRSMADVLPVGVWGARGTIIRRAGDQGAPIGHDPHAVARRVSVDPDIPGQSFVYDPTQIRKDAMEGVISKNAAERSLSVADRRFKAANVFREFAIASQADPLPAADTSSRPRTAPINLPGVYVVPEATDEGGQQPMTDPNQFQPAASTAGLETGRPPEFAARGVSTPATFASVPQPQSVATPAAAPPPLAASPPPPNGDTPAMPRIPESLFQPQRDVPAATPAPVPVPGAVAANATAGPPTVRVVFDIEGGAYTSEAYFHRVTREGPNLVFVFDNRAVGYPRVFPKSVSQDLAVHIVGSAVIYVTQTTGIRFPLDNYDICVLLIKDELPFQ